MLSRRLPVVGALFLLAAAAIAGPVAPPPIHAYYFTAPLCPNCKKGENLVARLVGKDPQIRLHTINVFEPKQYEVGVALLVVAGIGGRKLPLGPGLLVGHTYVDRGTFRPQTVQAALNAYRATGAPDLTAAAMPLVGHAQESLPQDFRRWGLLPFLLAGLLDGVNPCALTTLVFFLSYLAMMGTRGWSLLAIGLSFAAGVFGAYFAFGLGLLHALWALDGMPVVRQALSGLIALVCVGFAWLSWRDHRRLRVGETGGVSLQLPLRLKQQTHALIRRGLRADLVYGAAFVLGLGVASIELACTAQVYVPALIYMLSLSSTRGAGVGWLALYDLMFVTPILALLAVVVRGTSLQRLRQVAAQQAARTKLYLALFFLLCGAYFAGKAAGVI